MKTAVKYILQKILGFRNYLYLFSLFTIWKLKWDKHEKDFIHFLHLLPDDGIVLDIGANIGVMSYYLAKHYPDRKVLAFEPIPYNFNNLKKIIQRYKLKNVRAFAYALGDKDGTLDMVLPVEKSVRFHGLAHVRHESISENNQGELITCEVKRLDSISDLHRKEIKITGIKIDVENFEYFVFKGGADLLKKHKPVIYCELWDNDNRKNSIDLLTQLGYVVKVIEKDKLEVWQSDKHTTQNFFFLPGTAS